MHGTARGARGLAIGLALALGACRPEPQGREETGLEGLRLDAIEPSLVVPGSTVELRGGSFLDEPLGTSWLHLEGTYADGPLDTDLPLTFVDFDRMELRASPGILGLLGAPAGAFSGRVQVVVDYGPDGSRHASVPKAMELRVAEHLQPELDRIDAASTIFVNEPIDVHGEGLLLGGDEGTTLAVVEGCFAADAGDGTCVPVGPVEVPVGPAAPFDRTHGIFAFSPRIAGIRAGDFSGTVTLRNQHPDGEVLASSDQALAVPLREARITAIGDGEGLAVGTLGRFIDVHGDGFVGPDDGGTVLRFLGSYAPDGAPGPVPVDLELVPAFVDGRTVRYVINEDDALAAAIDVRQARGTYTGQVAPLTAYAGDEVEGIAADVSFRLEPVRQVVYLQWNPTYVESLRLFGLRAADPWIRARVHQVLARDYAGVGVEVRPELPLDYALYSTVEIAGPDPNGLGLLGYDNTPGKDTGNVRLDDRIGGVNAQTIEGGYPGFGGVFMESLFSFSEHPPAGTVETAPIAAASFDQIFDPFRPDRGQPVTSDEVEGGVVALDSGAGCPAADRPAQIACAVFVLGSVVGSTVSHELGHSLGLADPEGDQFHNTGDLPDRLMDAGNARGFEERAELMGQGPARFCSEAYQYLQVILPPAQPVPPGIRPPC